MKGSTSLTSERLTAIYAFAEAVQAGQSARMAKQFPTLDPLSDSYRVKVKAPGPKYTRVDVGDSGRYMVDNATGEIFGIKGYGVVHKGHRYGTLESVGEWDWSGYYPVKVTK